MLEYIKSMLETAGFKVEFVALIAVVGIVIALGAALDWLKQNMTRYVFFNIVGPVGIVIGSIMIGAYYDYGGETLRWAGTTVFAGSLACTLLYNLVLWVK